MTIWQFRPWFGSDWCSVLYTNLRQPHLFKRQISGINLVLHLSKYGTLMKRWCLDIVRWSKTEYSLIYNSIYRALWGCSFEGILY